MLRSPPRLASYHPAMPPTESIFINCMKKANQKDISVTPPFVGVSFYRSRSCDRFARCPLRSWPAEGFSLLS